MKKYVKISLCVLIPALIAIAIIYKIPNRLAWFARDGEVRSVYLKVTCDTQGDAVASTDEMAAVSVDLEGVRYSIPGGMIVNQTDSAAIVVTEYGRVTLVNMSECDIVSEKILNAIAAPTPDLWDYVSVEEADLVTLRENLRLRAVVGVVSKGNVWIRKGNGARSLAFVDRGGVYTCFALKEGGSICLSVSIRFDDESDTGVRRLKLYDIVDRAVVRK